jgi:hypothetical protein
MDSSPFRGANSHSGSQFFRSCTETEDSPLALFRQPVPNPYPERNEVTPHSPLRPILLPIRHIISYMSRPHVQLIQGSLSLTAKRSRREPSTHLHLVPKLRMTEATPPLPLRAFMTWTGTTLPSRSYECCNACYISHPPNPSWVDHHNYIWWGP